MLINDPRLILQPDLPLIILSNQPNSLISALIDWRTDGSHCHAMLMIDHGEVVTQGFTYKTVPIDNYMKKNGEMTFVALVNSNISFKIAFRNSVDDRLKTPWYHKMYDFLGIFGQAIGMPWIHTPGLEYCSVDVIRHLTNACGALPKSDQDVINAIPAQTNPQRFWEIIRNNPDTFAVYGRWSSDEGVIT